ncbi:hypothetical protein ACFZB5_13655 [Streptomyces nodosus]
MIYFVLVVGLLAAITGWRHPNPETRGMCRIVGCATAVIAILLWGQW